MGTNNANPHGHIYSLPNEVFVQILSPFSTRALLPLTTVSHRFHALVLRILHLRLRRAAALKGYSLILECFHPSSRLDEPHVLCGYLGTDSLSVLGRYGGRGSLDENVDAVKRLGLGWLSSLYSRFRPAVMVQERAGGARLVPLMDGSTREDLVMTRPVNLEDFEDFSQLCVVVNVVKVMPRTNLLLSIIPVVDGVIRLFRDRLRDQEQRDRIVAHAGSTNPSQAVDGRILWVDAGQNVGLKLRVRRQSSTLPRDEPPSASYEIDIEELHVRTTRLLLAVERSQEEQREYRRTVFFTQPLL